MPTFKSLALSILKEAGKPLHVREITRRALESGLVTDGKTPEATMGAQLIVDVNTNGKMSAFVKTAPSTFAVNPDYKESRSSRESIEDASEYRVSKDVSTKQKGDIAEARIAELVTLYGESALSCYKPISDDEGIDLIVKRKGSLKTMYIQVKSRFGSDPSEIYTATVKGSSIADNYSVGLVFCYFDTAAGDLWDYLWFVPAPDFIRMCNKLNGGDRYGFVAGRQRRDSNKWDGYLIDKRSLADAILRQMKRL